MLDFLEIFSSAQIILFYSFNKGAQVVIRLRLTFQHCFARDMQTQADESQIDVQFFMFGKK